MIDYRHSLLLFFLLLGLAHFSTLNIFGQENANDESASQELVDLVIGLLSDDDPDMRAVGLEQVRTELSGESATQQLVELLPKLDMSGQLGLLGALGDRGDVSARPFLIEIAQGSSYETLVQAAAIEALGSLGNETDIPLLLRLLASDHVEFRDAARHSLVRLPGRTTPTALGDAMLHGPIPPRLILMDVVVERRAVEAIPQLLQMAVVSTASVRRAAMKALGEIGGAENLPGMVAGILKASSGAERDAAEKAVMFVCQRIENSNDRAVSLIAAMQNLPESDQLNLLSTLGRVGGNQSLKMIEDRISSSDLRAYKLGVRALCNWPDASVGNRLLELYQTEPRPEYRLLILNALIRIAPLADGRTSEERLQMLTTVMDLCSNDSQRAQLLRRSSAIRSMATLRYVLAFFDDPKLAVAAHQAAVELAHHRSLREPNKAEFDSALDRILGASKDAIVLERARRYKVGKTWVRQVNPPNNSTLSE